MNKAMPMHVTVERVVRGACVGCCICLQPVDGNFIIRGSNKFLKFVVGHGLKAATRVYKYAASARYNSPNKLNLHNFPRALACGTPLEKLNNK
jgi:hypothetical protein